MHNLRRIVTGHNDKGKSIVIIDGPPARSIGEEVGGLFELWNTDGKEINTVDDFDRADNDIILSPPIGGSKFRYFQIMPTPEGVPREVLDKMAQEAFDKIGAKHHLVDTTKHHAMHKTKSID